MINKKVAAVSAAFVSLALLLSACGSESSEPKPTVTVTEEATQEPAPVLTDEQSYINNLRSYNNFYIQSNTDTDLINLGYTLCESLDNGYTVLDIVTELSYGSFGQQNAGDEDAIQFAGLTIGAAVASFCPEYSYQVYELTE